MAGILHLSRLRLLVLNQLGRLPSKHPPRQNAAHSRSRRRRHLAGTEPEPVGSKKRHNREMTVVAR